MIELITSTACSSCLILEEALAKNDIPYREVNIKSLGSDEMGELEAAAKTKLIEIRMEGGSSSMAAIMSTPMIRYYEAGQIRVIFPVGMFDHGQIKIEALAAIKNQCDVMKI